MFFSVTGGAQAQGEKPLSAEAVEEFELCLGVPPKPDPIILKSEGDEGKRFQDYSTIFRSDNLFLI